MHPLTLNVSRVTILTTPYSTDKVIIMTDKLTTCPGVTDQPMSFVIDVVHGGGLKYATDILEIPTSMISVIET